MCFINLLPRDYTVNGSSDAQRASRETLAASVLLHRTARYVTHMQKNMLQVTAAQACIFKGTNKHFSSVNYR